PSDDTPSEIAAYSAVFSQDVRDQPVQVNSLVSQLGDLGAAQGIAGTLKAVLAVSKGQLPSGVVPSEPDSRIAQSKAVQIQRDALPLTSQTSSAIVVSCGSVDGTAYGLLVEHPDQAIERTKTPVVQTAVPEPAKKNWHIVRIGAENWDTLHRLLLDKPAQDLYQPERAFRAPDRARLSFVVSQPEEFEALCRIAGEWMSDRTTAARDRLAGQGIYFGEPQLVSGGCAFVFPGQGSQYPGMLREMIAELPEARAACRRADAAMAALGYESFTRLAGPQAEGLGSDIWKTQISMLLADTITEDMLRQLGLRPALVAGHSFGEYAALVCSGAWSLTDAIRCTRFRYRSIVETDTIDGCMAATDAPPEVLQRCLAAAGEGVFVANLNAPDQTIISGRRDVVGRAVDHLKQQGCTAVVIKVPCPFHTPLMAGAARHLEGLLQEIPLRDSLIPVVSTASSQLMTQSEEFSRSLTDQLTKPVPYRQMLQQILERNPALIVEVGPQQVLTRLNRKNHPADWPVFIATDVRRRSGARSLLGVLAQAECLGCLELDDWRRTRTAKKAVTAEGRIVVFDATQRRIGKKRAQAHRSSQTTEAPPARKAPEPREPVAMGSTQGRWTERSSLETPGLLPADRRSKERASKDGFGHGTPQDVLVLVTGESGTRARRKSLADENEIGQRLFPQMAADLPTAANAHREVSAAVSPATRLDTSESRVGIDPESLRRILVDFVVDQTGYPEEIIEFEADLEADLGIDSIKKAQLFGEIGERFRIAPRDDLSLDDFPTLEHVLAFLTEELGGRSPQTPVAAAELGQELPAGNLATAPLPAEKAGREEPAAVSPATRLDTSESRVGI
ncbi:MAG: acyltransferase domain-containing protein, partial [Planctomycetaceae bacterium]